MFENAEVPLDSLPRADTVEWQSMDRKFIARQVTDALIIVAIVAAAVVGFQYFIRNAVPADDVDISIGWLWFIMPAAALLMCTWPFVSVPRMGYAVRERDILYRSGVFFRSVTAVPYNRIQHVEKSSTPLDRRFQVASLQLFTAGGSGGDLKIHGLSARTAEKLRVYILNKVGTSVEVSEDRDATADGRPGEDFGSTSRDRADGQQTHR